MVRGLFTLTGPQLQMRSGRERAIGIFLKPASTQRSREDSPSCGARKPVSFGGCCVLMDSGVSRGRWICGCRLDCTPRHDHTNLQLCFSISVSLFCWWEHDSEISPVHWLGKKAKLTTTWNVSRNHKHMGTNRANINSETTCDCLFLKLSGYIFKLPVWVKIVHRNKMNYISSA